MTDDRTNAPTFDRRPERTTYGDLATGMEIGEYRVLGKIGQGGMGAVFAAVQPVIGKRAAIKVLVPSVAANPEAVRRFVDEARAVNKIGHPNIVDIFSFGWLPDGRHYFVMEMLEGKNLASRLREGGLPMPEARRILKQICEALEAAHRQGVVHRDLKPDNIWVSEPAHGDSFAKLLDFGIAKLSSNGESVTETKTGMLMGTPLYISPEQCRGEHVGPSTDIYALGVILYEMFAGRLPFNGVAAELVTHHLMSKPPPPSQWAVVPRALERVILSCLEKDPAARPLSAEALGRALEDAFDEAENDAEAGAQTNLVASAGKTMLFGATRPAADSVPPLEGKTNQSLTLPARNRRPLWLVAALGGAALGGVVLWAMSPHESPRQSSPLPPHETSAAAEQRAAVPTPTPTPEAPPRGRAHILVHGPSRARILVDGEPITHDGHEADATGLLESAPHVVRVEADGFAPLERTFAVTASHDVTIDVVLSRSEHDDGKARHAPAEHRAPAAGSRARSRDSLVGEDIFDRR